MCKFKSHEKIYFTKLQMGRIGEKLKIDFVISTGDNFYDNGLTSVYDPDFRESFTKIYTAKSLQKPWYSGKSLTKFNSLKLFHFQRFFCNAKKIICSFGKP